MRSETKHIQSNKVKWDKWAGLVDGNGWRREFLRDAQRKLISLLDVKENVHFLDVGCGTGWAVGEAAKLVDFKGQFFGIDLSPKMIKKAKVNFACRDNFYFIEANAESIPLRDDVCDIVICTHSFHHYLNPNRVLREMHRVLKKGGKLYIVDTTADNWIIQVADVIIRLAEPQHVRFYSTDEFRQMFANEKLKYEISQTIKRAHLHVTGISKVHLGEK